MGSLWWMHAQCSPASQPAAFRLPLSTPWMTCKGPLWQRQYYVNPQRSATIMEMLGFMSRDQRTAQDPCCNIIQGSGGIIHQKW